MQRLLVYLLASTALVPLSIGVVVANPLDPVVQAGSVTVTGEGTANLNVLQSTDKAIIDWRTFDIGLGEVTTFVQPDAQSVVLNRVVGGEGASYILGRLSANGKVFLINPDGILFGTGATVDVGSLVATTHDLLNEDFLSGNYDFKQSGNPAASIVNLGTITVTEGGFAALVAPGVRNAGVIRASLGKVGLASADSFALDFYGDGLIQLAVDDTTAGEVIDLETGETLKDLVSNSGLLSADGGLVSLTASAARAVVDSVINNTGNIEANSIGTRNGKIVLGAATADVKPAEAPAQRVAVSGKLSATGDNAGETGGAIEITGEVIELTIATIEAFGWNGGGKVLIGGDYMGGNGDPAVIAAHDIALESRPIPTASYLFADEQTIVSANALGSGNGGKIILWSNEATLTAAALNARGGSITGDGGFIETSGKFLDVRAAADASAPNGEAGTWLLDPLNVRLKAGVANNWFYDDTTIFTDISVGGTYYSSVDGRLYYPNGSDSYLDTNVLSAALNAGNNVYVTTRGTVGSADGDIYVESDIRRTAGTGTRFLTLDAADDIIISSGVDLVSTTGKMNIFLWTHDGAISAPSMGQIDTNGGVFKIDVRDGVTLHSDYDMPDNFGLEVFAQSGAPRRDVDIVFDDDIIKFYYQNGVTRIPSDGIQLVDSSDGYFELLTHNMDFVLYDRAVRVAAHRPSPGVYVDGGFNYGADPSADLNGVAELIWTNPPTFPIADEPPSGQAVPVLELSTNGDAVPDVLIPTSQKGQTLLAQRLAGLPEQTLPIAGATEQVFGISWTTANSTPSLPVLASPTAEGLERWTGRAGDLTPQQVVNSVRLYLAVSEVVYGKNTLSSWLEYGAAMGLSTDDLERVVSNGFNASIMDKGGKIIIGFEGSGSALNILTSEDFRDWTRINVPNQWNIWKDAAGFDSRSTSEFEQYILAAALTKAVMEANPGREIVLTGHSLGGGLAAYAAAMNDLAAITFDPAGIRLNEEEQMIADTGGILNLVIQGGGVDFDNTLGTTLTFTSSDMTKPTSSNAISVKNHYHKLDRFWELISGVPASIM